MHASHILGLLMFALWPLAAWLISSAVLLMFWSAFERPAALAWWLGSFIVGLEDEYSKLWCQAGWRNLKWCDGPLYTTLGI